ncbi:TetR/AcrR family transcriptional regulator [Pseudonocardia sp. TRM90224]|uniref:TetR/AcrR family transcriptional regulator n=1 Tax=Pseudonocardia sp. TRM90224 TaxID=2812678 RepID=UPI001E31C3BD|nr:TetR/AcrR family transcriptional regulator [Pseudonocardia sp. TRM90224]
MPTAPMSGRRAQAARNDELILKAARDVFVADPGAPIAAVAERAGVGISALYRRYGSKEDMLRKLCADGLEAYNAIAEAAVASDRDPWGTFAEFFRGVVVADTHALTISLAGAFAPTPELYALAMRSDELVNAIVDRAHEAGVLRTDVYATDLGMLFEQLSSVRRGGDARTEELRSRYVALVLSSLRTPPQHEPLPGPAPQPGEFKDRWTKKT